MPSSEVEERYLIKPSLSAEGARRLAEDLYGLKVRDVQSMVSYDDLNFHITTEDDHTNPHLAELWPHGYTMKVVNTLDTAHEGFQEAIQSTFLYLKSKGVSVPVPVHNSQGKLIQRIHLAKQEPKPDEGFQDGETNSENGGTLFAVHLLTYLPGKPLSAIQYTPHALKDVGRKLAQIISAFQDYSNEVLEKRSTLWSLHSVPKVKNFIFAVRDPSRRKMLQQVVEEFENVVVPAVHNLPQKIIHGDLNEHNMLVNSSSEISGILDLGDLQLGPRVFEVSVCAVYSMLGGEERLGSMDPLLAPGYILAGLRGRITLTEQEEELLKPCMAGRLAQSLTMGEYTFHLDPSNEYTLDSARFGWTILERLRTTDPQELLERWNRIAEEDESLNQ